MNDSLAQAQQQMEAMEASMHQLLAWGIVVSVAVAILVSVGGFFYARWFLLHVFEIQQKRFFTQLDIFLHQRGIAPHIPESAAPAPAQQNLFRDAPPSPVKTAVRDMAAELDTLIAKGRTAPDKAPSMDRTPLERAWEDLNPPAEPGDDERFKPKG